MGSKEEIGRRKKHLINLRIKALLGDFPCIPTGRDFPCETCCLLCSKLHKCLWKWRTGDFFCFKVQRKRWCSAIERVMKESGRHEEKCP